MTNCPPVYRNLQCESFSNKRKITSQMLRQFCKNDAYLYEQIMDLWDKTDPESRKRFYPPDFMDVAHSFGIESYALATDYEKEEFNYWSQVYRFNRTTRFNYIFDFDGSNDKIIEYDENGVRLHDSDVYYTNIYADSYLDVENNYGEQMLEVVNENGVTSLKPQICTSTYEETFHYNDQYTTVTETIITPNAPKKTKKPKTRYVTKKVEKLGKAKKDAHFYGAMNNWDCNNHWYNGFNRTKNYNIKSKWKKDPDSYDIPSVCHSQTFKALNTGRVSKVNLNVQGSKNAVSPCIVEIRETTAKGYPSKKVLARTEKKFSGSGENIVAFTFKNKAKVTKGETYAIVVRSPLSTFANCYRLGGWTTGCFSSSKKYYSGGSAFTSEDNGKTWVKNGKTKDTQSYGKHYYDWGINQKPVDFAFEVYVQPITVKPIKEAIISSNVAKAVGGGYSVNNGYTVTTKSSQQLLKGAYDETFTYEYSYIKKGSYYLHLKPIQINPIDNFSISSIFTDGVGSQYWKWEYFDIGIGDWVEIGNNEIVEYDNNVTNYTILKLRIRCDVLQNTYIDTTSTITDSSLNNLISSQKLIRSQLSYLQSATLRINTKKPTKAYLRTLYYYPPQNQILGANIWSEIGVTAQNKGSATLEIDIIQEKLASDHFKFYDLNILNEANMDSLTTQQEELITIMRDHINSYENRDESTYIEYSASRILDYVYNDKTVNESVFIDYLRNLLTPVYLLPLYYDGATNPTLFFEELQLNHMPSYPLNASEIGDDDITIDISKFTGLSDYGFYYTLDKSISPTLSSIDVVYTVGSVDVGQNEVVIDENGFEANESDIEERIQESLKGIFIDKTLEECLNGSGNVAQNIFKTTTNGITTNNTDVDYAITKDGCHIIFNRESPKILALFTSFNPYTFTTSLAGDSSVNDFELKINLTKKTYQEFVDFEVDYDDGTIKFYNQLNLISGDFNITYNPLWVRGLSIADFPLKMDLWKEKYIVGEDNGDKGILKLKYDKDNDKYVSDKFYPQTTINPYTQRKDVDNKKYYTLKTTVPPLDNIRKLVINEGKTSERQLIEDSQFFVDYLSNKIVFYINDLSETDTITVHYTPNLTDNGLALAYRIKRGRYDSNDILSTDDDLESQPKDTDDIYIGMNYFTYRT